MTSNDWTTLPLAGDGRSLVEASAGTGKTWTISVLYLRLLLEQGLSPRQIVVSTFTNAAAAELRERLRARVLWALGEADRCSGSHGTASSEAQWLEDRWKKDPARRQDDAQRLTQALTELDAAPVCTLHALCSRILADHPFASGALFRGRTLVDGKMLQSSLVDDLWRAISQGDAGSDLPRLARDAGIKRSQLRDKYVPALLQPNVVAGGVDRKEVLRYLEGKVGKPNEWALRLQKAANADGLLRSGGKTQTAWTALSNALLQHDGDPGHVLSVHAGVLANPMQSVNNKGKEDPEIQALAALSARVIKDLDPVLLDRMGNRQLRDFLAAAQDWCRNARNARLQAARQSTFDQLLHDVRDALHRAPDGSRALADALFAAWPVALVDEFQDTDPVQFDILDAIYRDAEGQPRGRLVMIGDPKQAIYRFRGGDVKAYVRARDTVPEEDRLVLKVNFRSSAAYVEGMNSFYARVGRRLGPSGSNTPIEYRDVVASEGETSRERLLDAKAGEVVRQPLVIHWLAVGDEPDENAALSACAGQIVHVLSEDVGYIVHERKKDGNHMEKRRLRPADIAVLLPTNAQLKAMARKLKARGVPCVMQANASVFDGEVARELRLLLHAALHPANPRALRAAAATRTWGVSFGELRALRHDPANWDKLVDEFQRLHQLLQHRGPLAFVARLLDQRAPSLLDTVEGERWLTDLRHLGELLQEAYDTLGSGERLAGWFGQQVAGDDDEAGSDARALRLESDTGRVKLLTLHSSKGLEFPVVFLPLMWKHGSKSSKRAQLLADETGEHKGIVLGDTAKKLVKEEEYEERFRMLYVALTRAQWACHLFVVPPPAKEPKDAPLNAVCGNLVPPTKGEECAGMAWRDGWITHGGLRYAGEGRADRRTDARPLPAAPPGPLPMRHSFTTLTGHGLRSATEEAATEDEPLDAETVEGSPAATAAAESAPGVEAALSATTFHPDLDALHGVAGPEFGNALHAIFEHRVPGAPLGEQSALVLDALRREGVRMGDDAPGLVAAVARRLQDMLDAPLGTPDGPCLGLLGTSELRAEPEFNYALDGVRLADLRAACERHGEPGLAPAREQTLAGLMNGKIDLLFMHSGRVHVLDYKSNRLGQRAKPCLEDYAPDAIDAAMRGTGYRLQALLYTVAVERYLRERLGARYRRDQHLGDCWYLFVRATGLRLPDGRACGVWRHRFSDGLLDAVQAVFGRGSRREVA